MPCWIQVAGLQHHAPPDVVPGTTTVEVVGTLSHKLSSSPDGDKREDALWESGGSVRAYLREALAPDIKHTIGIKVRNPVRIDDSNRACPSLARIDAMLCGHVETST